MGSHRNDLIVTNKNCFKNDHVCIDMTFVPEIKDSRYYL